MKVSQSWTVFILSFSLLASSCGQNKAFKSAAGENPVMQMTAAPVVNEDGPTQTYTINTGTNKFQVGLLKTKSLTVDFNRETNDIILTGAAEIYNPKTRKTEPIKVHLQGHKDENGLVNLKPVEKESKDGIRVRAKMICANLDGTTASGCDQSIIDLFVKFEGEIHTDQSQTKTNEAKKIEVVLTEGFATKTAPTAAPAPVVAAPVTTAPSAAIKKPDAAAAVPKTNPEAAATADETQDPTFETEYVPSPQARFVGRVYEPLIEFDDDENENAPAVPTATTPVATSITPASPAPVASPVSARESQAPVVQTPTTQAPSAPVIVKKETPKKSATETKAAAGLPSDYKICGPGIACSAQGEIRGFNQAIGNSSPLIKNGKVLTRSYLLNGTSLIARMEANPSFKERITLTTAMFKRHFGTYELVKLVDVISQNAQKIIKDYKLRVSDLSQAGGGRLKNSKHVSHQNGTDVDLGYMVEGQDAGMLDVVNNKGQVTSEFLIEKNWQLLKSVVDNKTVPVTWIFTHRSIKNALCAHAKKIGDLEGENAAVADETLRRLRHQSGHENHFHVRIACSKFQPFCLQDEPPPGIDCPK